MMEDEVNVRFLALSTQQPAFLAHFEELLGLHLLATLPPFPIRAVVAENIVQRGARIEPVFADRELEADLAIVIQCELIKIDNTVVVEIRSLKLTVYVVLYLLRCLQQSFRSEALESSSASMHTMQIVLSFRTKNIR
jgi:hypothetical protein